MRRKEQFLKLCISSSSTTKMFVTYKQHVLSAETIPCALCHIRSKLDEPTHLCNKLIKLMVMCVSPGEYSYVLAVCLFLLINVFHTCINMCICILFTGFYPFKGQSDLSVT